MKIALVENFGSDFFGARLRYALFLKDKGHHVIAIVPNDGFVEKIRNTGIDTIAVDVDIRERNVKSMFIYGKELRKIFKKECFDVVHLYRMQPNLIGTPIAFFSNKKSKIINHITGLGVAFTKNSLKYRLIKFLVKGLYNANNRFFSAKLVFQNNEDKRELGNKKDFLIVKGSAVNEDNFTPSFVSSSESMQGFKEMNGFNEGMTLIFVSRLLKQKGLSFLIESVQEFNLRNNQKVNLMIVGWIDPNNPDSYTEKEIEEFSKLDRVIFLGKRNDVNELIALSDVAALPTYYREGTPRFLLEAMAMGKPILTTDMPGCNHLIRNGENGILVEPKSAKQLIDALEQLSKRDLKKLGQKSREIYEIEFSEKVVYNQLLNIYSL